jgi:uracil-DNA glycosylase
MTEGRSDDLRSQVRKHLESLQAAGVLFLPRGVRVERPSAVQSVEGLHVAVGAEPVADPLGARRHELTLLAGEVERCDRCSELYSTRTQTVFGTGPLDAELAFVGHAPGSDEDAQGEPFAGKGGELLSRIIGACGFTRDSVYLFNVIKCRPPKNRAPSDGECANCRAFFDRQFDLVRPKHLVALGPFASRWLTDNPKGKLRGTVHSYRGVPLVCTHHPDDIVKDASDTKKRETWEDMKLMLRTMGRTVS